MKCQNPDCGANVEYHRTTCKVCGTFAGYPNVRKAAGMAIDLHTHYERALAAALARGTQDRTIEFELLLETASATINTDVRVVQVMALSQPYLGYYKSVDAGLREIAEEKYQAHREAVDAKICPGYHREIVVAALSPDGSGLRNYGPVVLCLKPSAIVQRASVLRENSFDFYENFDLGKRNAQEISGWRAVWADRARLGVAYRGSEVTSSLAYSDLPRLVLENGKSRDDDRFMEVQIYGPITLKP